MNTKLYIKAALCAAAISFTGCGDSFLDVDSPTQQPIEEYFTTDAHIQEAVVAAYQPLWWPDWAMNEYNPVNIMSDIMADDLWVGGSDKNDNANWHRMMNFEAAPNAVIAGLWTDAYSGVKRCNDVIAYMNDLDVVDLTEENAKYYEAQVRVLRVFYYNWLWKFWGNVVYFEKNFDGAPYLGTQYTADEIYEFMIADLEGVIAMNNLLMKESDENLGRVTKAMAYMLYAEIVMYQNDESRFGTALNYMKEIINEPGYGLNPDYANIFTASGEWTSESIYEIGYTDDNAVRSWSNPLYPGGTVLPTLISPSNWPSGVDGHDDGWGFCPMRLETYQRYAAGDTRRDATCWNAAAAGEYNQRYQDTGFFLEKYAAHTGDNARQKADAQLNWNNNLRIYRYSETLLNAAELIARGAGSGDAQGYMDQVRSRAGLPSIPATVDNILEERHLEFVGEGKRYWDLIRSGKAASVLVPDEYGYRTNTWSANKKHLPIPQSEIDKARGTLTQNPY